MEDFKLFTQNLSFETADNLTKRAGEDEPQHRPFLNMRYLLIWAVASPAVASHYNWPHRLVKGIL